MAWIMDVYSMQKGRSVPAVVTGKPLEIGGTVGRNEASGTGMYYILNALLEKLGKNIKTMEVVIQGFGNV
jgi:glutamate dehydrogenase/leucine dehydrogenase